MAGERGQAQTLVYQLLSREEKLRKGIHDNDIVTLVDDFLYKALLYNASDVHFQPYADYLLVRYRIDGILYDQQEIVNEQAYQLISRIKVLSSLDIAEKRLPQDGKFNVEWGLPRDSSLGVIDFRVSTFPTIYGEKLVIRILDRSAHAFELTGLGMNAEILNHIKRIVALPHGFFLVTGPTGSGKTTTLYAMLSQINYEQKNIVTMEDPVEYNLAGVMQSQVNDHIGFSFENGLRSLLRQDPDVIMIGEIRDKKTAQIAVESALTGHLVFSTLHTNDAISVVSRLLDMGVEPFLINATLSGVLAQRLLRRLCDNCKYREALQDDKKKLLELYHYSYDYVYQARGCEQCYLLGYKGRIGIFEFVPITDNLRSLVTKNPSIEQLNFYLQDQQIKTLIHDALDKLGKGIISLDDFISFLAWDS